MVKRISLPGLAAPGGAKPFLALCVLALALGLVVAKFFYTSVWAVPVGGVGALYLLTRERAGSFRLGFCYAIGLFAPLFQFTQVSMGNPLGWVALTIFESLYLALFAWLWAAVSGTAWVREHLLSGTVIFAFLFAGCEQLRSSWPLGGFAWARLAQSQIYSPLLPLASWLGSSGLTFVVALLGALGALGLVSLLRLRLEKAVTALALAALLGVGPTFIELPTAAQAGTLRVGAVQGSIPGKDPTQAFSREMLVTGQHVAGTRKLQDEVGAGGVDVVLWPENSADLDPRSYPQVAAVVTQASEDIKAPIVVGGVLYDDGASSRYNDMIVWNGADGAGEIYRKHHPVPFGEYVPWRGTLRKITKQVDRIGTDMRAGSGSHTLTFTTRDGRKAKLAVGICFEAAYDNELRAGVHQEGGQALYIPTNNASFVGSDESRQQLYMGRLQAVIHGRAVVQVSTTGISATIGPDGQIRSMAKSGTQMAIVDDLPLRRDITIADRCGGLIDGFLTFGFVIVGLGFAFAAPILKKKAK